MFGSTVSPQLVQSGKGRIASDPALLYLHRLLMVGAFSIHGSDEQIFGRIRQVRETGQCEIQPTARERLARGCPARLSESWTSVNSPSSRLASSGSLPGMNERTKRLRTVRSTCLPISKRANAR